MSKKKAARDCEIVKACYNKVHFIKPARNNSMIKKLLCGLVCVRAVITMYAIEPQEPRVAEQPELAQAEAISSNAQRQVAIALHRQAATGNVSVPQQPIRASSQSSIQPNRITFESAWDDILEKHQTLE